MRSRFLHAAIGIGVFCLAFSGCTAGIETEIPHKTATDPLGDPQHEVPRQGMKRDTESATSSPTANLLTLSTPASYTAQVLGPSTECAMGYRPPPQPSVTMPSAFPVGTGAVYNRSEVATWKARSAGRAFVSDNDYAPGSPGDWNRIIANASKLSKSRELRITGSNDESIRHTGGVLARDAAFAYLITGEPAYLAAVKVYLLRMVSEPLNDFSSHCFRERDGAAAGYPFFNYAPWLARFVSTYDFVRGGLDIDDRLAIESYILRQGRAFAAFLDYSLASIFPHRLEGDYSDRASSAAPRSEVDTWWRQRYDTNDDCIVNDADDPQSYLTYAYAHDDGSPGPRISVLSQWFNNRTSGIAMAAGLAGAAVNDPMLINRSARYFMEWVTFGMFPDGSDGDFVRNGNYCIPSSGVIYSYANIEGALLVSRAMVHRGDTSLVNFKTRGGLFGTQSIDRDLAKSLATAIQMHLDLINGKARWYMYEGAKRIQAPRPETYLGTLSVDYMRHGRPSDNSHELGLIFGAADFPSLPISATLLRDPQVTTTRFLHSTGNPVDPGWSDRFGVMPAAYLLRP